MRGTESIAFVALVACGSASCSLAAPSQPGTARAGAAASVPEPPSTAGAGSAPISPAAPKKAVAPGPPKAVFIAAQRASACAALDDGRLVCWGGGGFTRDLYGDGTLETATRPVVVDDLQGGREVHLGTSATQLCTLSAAGEVRCRHHWGKLGPGALRMPRVTQIAVGEYHACAVTDRRTVVCWGKGDGGALGDGAQSSSDFRAEPLEVAGITDAAGVAAGFQRTCAWTRGGAVSCWGLNQGPGRANATSPVRVPELEGATLVSASMHQDCALRTDGEVRCFVAGVREVPPAKRAALFPDGSGVKDAIDLAVDNQMACAATRSGPVLCWGKGQYGMLGDGKDHKPSKAGAVRAPQPVPEVSGLVDIETSGLHSCGRNAAGDVWCWGDNVHGQLGGGRPSSSPQNATRVVGLSGATQLALGEGFTCALRRDGTVWCWGESSWGQTGNGAAAKLEPVPVRVLLPQ